MKVVVGFTSVTVDKGARGQTRERIPICPLSFLVLPINTLFLS